MGTKTGEQHIDKSNVVGKKPVNVEDKMVSVTFKENRKYDLHIGRNVIVFLARETKEINAKFLTHPDWIQAKNLFNIKK